MKRSSAKTAKTLLLLQLMFFPFVNVIFLFSMFSSGGLFYLARVIYVFNTIFFPILFIASGAIGLAVNRDDRSESWLGRLSIIIIVVAFLLIGVRVYATHIEPNRLVIRHVKIKTPKVAMPVYILHMSDIQSEKIGPFEEKVFQKIQELAPDLILDTGDMLDPIPPATTDSELKKAAKLFRGLNPPFGKYTVYGNFDFWNKDDPEIDLGGLKILDSEEVIIMAKGSRIRILGLSLGNSRQSRPESDVNKEVEKWLEKASPNEYTIVMGHCPDYILAIKDLHVDLCLAGHTHGGQVRVPFYGAIVTLSRIPREWARGFRKVGNTFLNVSAGLGNEHAASLPDIRVFCPPEITLIELAPESD